MRWPWDREKLVASPPHRGKDGTWHFEIRTAGGILVGVSPPRGYATEQFAEQAIARLSEDRIEIIRGEP